jgi:ADP-ribose pyrophosphatase YjhB (NUDIX family)
MRYAYDYPHPAVTVDVAVFTIEDGELAVLLIRRAAEPFAGRWALPGGFVEIRESLRRAAWRELHEETGIRAGFLEQLAAFGRPDRDPRERVISVAYYALVPRGRLTIRAASDAADARLFRLADLPELAFDHAKILRRARERLREKGDDAHIAMQLMPTSFTLSELHRAQELICGRSLDKRNFRKRILATDLVEPTGEKRRVGRHRPAALYRARHARDLPYRSRR